MIRSVLTKSRNVRIPSMQYYSAHSKPSATATIRFKDQVRQNKYSDAPASFAEDAVRNILHNAPPISEQRPRRHILNCLVKNKPGALSRLSGVLASRNFNIESIVAADTEVPDLSRMTIVLNGPEVQIEQAKSQLEDLIPVWAVLDYTDTKLIERELLLIKVSILGPDHLHEQMSFKNQENGLDMDNEEESVGTSLRNTFDHLRALNELAALFDAKIVDVSSDSVIIELAAKPERIRSFMKLCKPFGIIEASKTGVMAMPRVPVIDLLDDQHDTTLDEEDTGADLSNLPPG
ncbi:small subunit of acetolactate synthase-domain-containing protein [Helicostylum pulchrum]|uniref:ACT domain-containing protein n=1 Tax=Helicostylum pulchrum TaxID=562976 RepID=A0ABP9XTW9_9FUNG|nr:small subunit of acetolactate synthase-domain-containing protein [Helicostylum pulchrum]